MILVLTMCLGLQCEPHRIPLLSEVTPWQCQKKGQEVAAEKFASGFFGEGYTVARISCERKKERQS